MFLCGCTRIDDQRRHTSRDAVIADERRASHRHRPTRALLTVRLGQLAGGLIVDLYGGTAAAHITVITAADDLGGAVASVLLAEDRARAITAFDNSIGAAVRRGTVDAAGDPFSDGTPDLAGAIATAGHEAGAGKLRRAALRDAIVDVLTPLRRIRRGAEVAAGRRHAAAAIQQAGVLYAQAGASLRRPHHAGLRLRRRHTIFCLAALTLATFALAGRRSYIDAILPFVLINELSVPFFFGGTGLLIVVGVALDTLQQIESHLLMRHYDGFLKKGRLRGRR